MAKFTDDEGAVWTLALSYADYLHLKRSGKLDLDAVRKDAAPLFLLVEGSALDLMPVLADLLRGQFAASGVTVDEFHGRLTPDVAVRAGDALLDAVWDFFRPRQQGRRPSLLTGEANSAPSTSSAANSPG